jgi:hypothetical protein
MSELEQTLWLEREKARMGKSDPYYFDRAQLKNVRSPHNTVPYHNEYRGVRWSNRPIIDAHQAGYAKLCDMRPTPPPQEPRGYLGIPELGLVFQNSPSWIPPYSGNGSRSGYIPFANGYCKHSPSRCHSFEGDGLCVYGCGYVCIHTSP